jgi:hypothetical protein
MIQTGEFFKQIKEWNQECRAKLQKEDLQQVCDLMLLIRGMALMSGCYQIAHIAELGEDIAAVGQHPKNSSNRRKCIGSVWDVVTTLDHLIATGVETTTEEQNILIHCSWAPIGSRRGSKRRLKQTHLLTRPPKGLRRELRSFFIHAMTPAIQFKKLLNMFRKNAFTFHT